MIGINVRATKTHDYASLIVSGTKILETRNTNSLKPYIGQRVGIIRTGKGKAQLIGFVNIDKAEWVSQEDFKKIYYKHLVSDDSEFACTNKGKWVYHLSDAQMHPATDVDSKGIIARNISF